MYNKDLTIFSVFHKEYPQPQCDFIQPIQVGKALTDTDLGFIKDNEGENISAKNPTYCELTALYWIWKNINQIDSEFLGLSHYRRYFTFSQTVKKKKLFFSIEKEDKRDVYPKKLTLEELNRLALTELKDDFYIHLKDDKIIVAKESTMGSRRFPNFTIKDNYIYNHIKEDWFLLEEAIAKMCPDYVEFATIYFSTTKEMHCFNMFIGNKNFLNNFCNFLFPILDELENTVKLSDYPYQRRIFGFMAERLLNLYIKKNEIKTATYPVVFFE